MYGMTCQKVFNIILFMVIMKHKKSLLIFAILTVASCGSLIISNLASAALKQNINKAQDGNANNNQNDKSHSSSTSGKFDKNEKNTNTQTDVKKEDKNNENKDTTQSTTSSTSTNSKGNNGCGTDTSIIKCDPGSDENPIINLLQQAVKVLYGVIGVLAVVVIMVAGVIYGTAGDREDRVKLAKTMITNTIIGILLYVFMTVILNFLVPGGVF